MKKLLTVLFVLTVISAPAQTLFTYGNEAVSANDFLKAFKKNNNGVKDEKALKEYLDLYIASRLKVKEAKGLRLDTLPQLAADLANLRQQILPTYLNDKESLSALVNEAFRRLQKDINAAHIFIAFTKEGITDTITAKRKKEEVIEKLNKGLLFGEAAKQYSDDPSAKSNGGNLGWLTVFSLPYQLENLLYTTPVGKFSTYQSNSGYHIFKNAGERKAAGRIKAAQILLALPPGINDAGKAILKKKADSIYTRLMAGDDFGKLATIFSNDAVSSASNGQMSEFGVGEFDPAFENAAFALMKDGAVSKPFLTSHGYHIVKRLKSMPVPVSLTAETEETLRRRIESTDRILTTKNVLAQKVLKQAGYKKLLTSDTELWAYTDSLLRKLPAKTKVTITPVTPLFKIGSNTATVTDWMAFAQNSLYINNGSGIKPYPQVWEEFLQATALRYYEDHLEDFNEDFRSQITEFAEGNLFFEIMQQKVWAPAQTDSVALLAHYQNHTNEYHWKQSADAVIFYAANEDAAKEFYTVLKKSPANWKSSLHNYTEQITADSARFELTQLPQTQGQKLTGGIVTNLAVNKGDNTVSFAYIINRHTKEEPRNFTEAKGLVINDYQTQLEKTWVDDLRKKYPVVVNEKVWKELVEKVGSGR